MKGFVKIEGTMRLETGETFTLQLGLNYEVTKTVKVIREISVVAIEDDGMKILLEGIQDANSKK